MKVFLETSSLVKRYLEEKGAEDLEEFFEKVSGVVVSPITWLEVNSAIHRNRIQKKITDAEAGLFIREAECDFQFWGRMDFNEELEEKAVSYAQKHGLKTFDCIQLASACLAPVDVFVTSDKRLYNAAKKEKEIAEVKFI